MHSDTLLEVNDLKMHFPIRKGLLQRQIGTVKAVDGVSFTIKQGETLSLVGESGCGKTTAGRCIVRAYKQKPTDGEILFQEQEGSTVDLASLNDREIKPYRKEIQMVFQDPFSSLNPRMNIMEIIGEPLLVNGIAQGKELEERVADLLRKVKLSPDYMRRYPHAFSGGQRQRIGIARALSVNPRLVIADEAVSALDVSVQAQILNLMQDLQQEMKLTYLFVAHNLSVVRYISDRVAVMYVGRIVELTETSKLFSFPQHPYTEALLANVPKPDPRLRSQRIVLQGEVPDPSNPPSGCHFHPRCPYVQERCKVETPPLRRIESDRYVACHFAEDLTLRGVEIPKAA
ncbi:MAG: dipeptide ABC transporter ATP-binding protein [Chloroflexales bacterium]|nr:dipeptide ABC transporter ATP-binding protein [Chloroflexales bacterium]